MSAVRVSSKYYIWSQQQFCKDELCSCKLYCTVRTLEIRHKPSSVFNMRAGIGFPMGALYEACTYRGPRLVVGLLSAILHVTRGCGGDVATFSSSHG